jgi:hypothetical protein
MNREHKSVNGIEKSAEEISDYVDAGGGVYIPEKIEDIIRQNHADSFPVEEEEWKCERMIEALKIIESWDFPGESDRGAIRRLQFIARQCLSEIKLPAPPKEACNASDGGVSK